jgi:hypothetical protein
MEDEQGDDMRSMQRALGLAAVAALAALLLPSSAAGQAPAPDPFWKCRASVARVALVILPNPLEPITANPNESPCNDDLGGTQEIAIPPDPPLVTTRDVSVNSDVLCREDDPDPTVDPEDNDACDAGRRAHQQQVVTRADAAEVGVHLEGLDLTVQAVNSGVSGACNAANRPVLTSHSQVVGLTINGQLIELPDPTQPVDIDLGIIRIQLNERIGAEGEVPAGSNGLLARRAVHITIPNVADVVLAESSAGTDGDVCTTPTTPPSPTPPPASCPPGTVEIPGPACIITNVICPDGTVFDPRTLVCVVTGGDIVPIDQVAGHRNSPCRAARFGRGFAIIGNNRPNRITGTNGPDAIFTFGGNDRVSGGRGNDCVEGGSGNDVVDGSNGNDLLRGGTGADQTNGGPGKDRLEGGRGRDKVVGGHGNDLLRGGPGPDGIHTGNGRDRVIAGPGNDIINAATRGPAARVNCGPGVDRVRINNNEVRRVRNCEFINVLVRIRSFDRPVRPRVPVSPF